ncbi:MAG: hypothetical protein NTY53_01710, partial [Kiritimatiellaeota bacterium]|nr:hypothetical protein [Kiritimatiellota bacterium]
CARTDAEQTQEESQTHVRFRWHGDSFLATRHETTNAPPCEERRNRKKLKVQFASTRFLCGLGGLGAKLPKGFAQRTRSAQRRIQSNRVLL